MVYNKYLENDFTEKLQIVFDFIKKGINLKNILFIILSIFVSCQSYLGSFEPFSMVIFAVASVFNVPLILVLISSLIGFIINSATIFSIIKLLAFFILFTFITAIVNIEGVSKKYSVYIKLMVSFFIVEIISCIIGGTFVSSILSIIINALVLSVLYFVFVPGVSVLFNINKPYVYSKEESIAMVLVVAISMSIFKDVALTGFSIYNVIIAMIILIYGWKNGAVLGATAGLVVGLFLNGITDVSVSYIISLAVSGLISGIFGRFGKLPVVIAFILGNIYVAYLADFSELTLRLGEVLIASISLLFVPKVLELKLEKLFNKNSTLDTPYQNILDSASVTRQKIGAVSEVFDKLSDVVIKPTKEDLVETRAVIKKYIKDYIENQCFDCKDKRNCLDDEKLDVKVDNIALKLENNKKLDETMLDFKCDLPETMINDITEIYNSMKLMRILKQKEMENSQKLSNQYKEVSKILSTVAKNIKNDIKVSDKSLEKLRNELKFYGYIVYEEEFKKDGDNIEYTFVTDILTNIDMQKKQIIDIASSILEQPVAIKLILNSSKKEKSRIKIVSKPMYEVQIGISSGIKDKEEVSGDSYISMELEDLKHISVISDGAGYGKEAKRASNMVINMLEKLLASGFDKEKAIEIINSVVKINSDDTTFSTIDTSIVNLKTGETEFIKLGAAPTYVIDNNSIAVISTQNLPVGIIKDSDYIPICKTLTENSLIIQISDGVINDKMNINDNYFKNYLQSMDNKKSSKIIAEELKKLVLKENKNVLNDDFTIIVTKLIKA